MFTRRFDRRVYVLGGALFLSLGLGVGFGAFALWPSRLEAGYSPEQPVPFSHETHAGTLEMDCLYCHSRAAKGAAASVPEVSVCMNCHNEVQPKDESGQLKEGIEALLSHWEEKRPIEWIKVNDVADFVYFDHSRHVNSDIECQECHGPVETMTRMRREHGLKMAFCIDCHMEDPLEPPTGKLPDHPGTGTRAPINCTTCHR